MKYFKTYIFPACYGLLVYFTIRLFNDLQTDTVFWKRAFQLNFIEISCSLLVGYASIYLFERLFVYYGNRWPIHFRYQQLGRELGILILGNLVLVNLIISPMAAFTDDGLSKADFVYICIVPTLYAIIYYGIARSRTYMMAYIENKVALEKVTNDHLATELKFLRAQYHPHFLFNALNTIYFQMDEDVPAAKTNIEKLSELLRYQLYDQQHRVPVKRELEYLKSFIHLQKARSSDKLKLQVNFDKALENQLVYPLLCLPLVENAFKFIGGDYTLSICASLLGKELRLRVENSVSDRTIATGRTGGIGLENLKRRLDLLYPEQYSFFTIKNEHTFIAELTLAYDND